MSPTDQLRVDLVVLKAALEAIADLAPATQEVSLAWMMAEIAIEALQTLEAA